MHFRPRINPTVILELNSVRFKWPGDHDDVIGIPRFCVDASNHTFIMGPSGSGKSTLLNIIGGVIRPQHGTVTLNDCRISELSATSQDRVRANSIGYIFQQFNLIPYLNAIENVLLPCRFSVARKNKARASAASLKDAALKLLRGFFPGDAPDFRRPVLGLSVGQQQRVAAARALIGGPSLIIADEPTSALDHEARKQFMNVLLDEVDKQHATLLFVSHDPTLSNQFRASVNMREINHVSAS